MSNESHIDFKEFDHIRSIEVERLYGEMYRQRYIAMEALKEIAGDDEERCRENNCGCRSCTAHKALKSIMSTRNTPMTEDETKTMRILELETQLEKAVSFSKELTDAFLKASGKLQAELNQALVSHDLITKGVLFDLQLNELYALEKGGFFVTLCSPEDNFSAEGETPIAAILKAVEKAGK